MSTALFTHDITKVEISSAEALPTGGWSRTIKLRIGNDRSRPSDDIHLFGDSREALFLGAMNEPAIVEALQRAKREAEYWKRTAALYGQALAKIANPSAFAKEDPVAIAQDVIDDDTAQEYLAEEAAA